MDPDAQVDPEQLKQRVQGEMQMQFVQQLVERLRDECFERCIQNPGTSLSSREQSCLGNCVERYMEGMSIVQNTIAKANSEQ